MYAAILLMVLAAQGPADLKADERLSANVTVRADAEMVGDVIGRMSDALGVRLRTSSEIEQDLIVLFAQERPAHEVLSVIAEHFEWEWRKAEEGYRLVQTSEAKREEERRLRELILEPYLKIGQSAKKALEEGESDRERLLKRWGEIQKSLSELPGYDEMQGRPPELAVRAALDREKRSLVIRVSSKWRLVSTVLAEMSDDEWWALDRDFKLVYSTNPTRWQRPISRKALPAARQLILDLAAEARGGANNPDPLMPIGLDHLPEDVAAVRVVLERSGFPTRSRRDAVYLSVQVALLDANGDALAVETVGAEALNAGGTEAVQTQKPPKHAKLDEPLRPSAGLLRANRPSLVVNEATLASEQSRVEYLRLGSKVDVLSDLGRLLNQVAASAGICVIADRYDNLGRAIEPIQTRTLGTALGHLAQQGRYEWSFDGTWARFRTEGWPLARASTVPRKTLYAFRDKVMGDDGYALDDLASLALAVTDRQACAPSLCRLWAGYWRLFSVEDGGATLYLLRMWAELTASQKAALLSRQPLSFWSLSPLARRQLEATIYRLSPDRTYIYGGGTWLGRALDRPSNSWYMERQFRGQWGKDITQLLPDGLPQDGEFRLSATAVLPKVFMKDNWGNLYLAGPGTVAEWRVFRERFGDTPVSYTYRAGQGVGIAFTFELGDSLSLVDPVWTSHPLPGSKFGEVTTLPAEMQKQIEKELSEMRTWSPPP